MPLNVFWDNEGKTIIRSQAEGQWTWEEYHAGLQQIVDMMNSVDHRVDLIHGHEPGARRPEGSGMPHFQRAVRIMPPNIGLNVFINTNAFGRAILSVFTSVYGARGGGRFMMVASLEAAYAIIKESREKYS